MTVFLRHNAEQCEQNVLPVHTAKIVRTIVDYYDIQEHLLPETCSKWKVICGLSNGGNSDDGDHE